MDLRANAHESLRNAVSSHLPLVREKELTGTTLDVKLGRFSSALKARVGFPLEMPLGDTLLHSFQNGGVFADGETTWALPCLDSEYLEENTHRLGSGTPQLTNTLD